MQYALLQCRAVHNLALAKLAGGQPGNVSCVDTGGRNRAGSAAAASESRAPSTSASSSSVLPRPMLTSNGVRAQRCQRRLPAPGMIRVCGVLGS